MSFRLALLSLLTLHIQFVLGALLNEPASGSLLGITRHRHGCSHGDQGEGSGKRELDRETHVRNV